MGCDENSKCVQEKFLSCIDSPNISPLLNAVEYNTYNTQQHYRSKQDPTHRKNNQDDGLDVLSVWGHSWGHSWGAEYF